MSGKKMKSSKQMGRKKHYLEPETVDLEYDEFSPSAPNFSTGTIPLQYRETSHYLKNNNKKQKGPHALLFYGSLVVVRG
ncbi:hypothetical protein OUZ56_005019 [Daphnia magna]|uniref:Uncharacterized protein n=1 Tax=Daphnia magna TaxID=35525 RepID=A0ABQ9YRK3_9CRUS|nr:hypothetical protein OUZ56_005019 [Daphnia magna]